MHFTANLERTENSEKQPHPATDLLTTGAATICQVISSVIKCMMTCSCNKGEPQTHINWIINLCWALFSETNGRVWQWKTVKYKVGGFYVKPWRIDASQLLSILLYLYVISPMVVFSHVFLPPHVTQYCLQCFTVSQWTIRKRLMCHPQDIFSLTDNQLKWSAHSKDVATLIDCQWHLKSMASSHWTAMTSRKKWCHLHWLNIEYLATKIVDPRFSSLTSSFYQVEVNCKTDTNNKGQINIFKHQNVHRGIILSNESPLS